MHCDITLLTLYWSGELSEQEAMQVEEHLANCADCRQELAELNSMQDVVVDMPLESAPRDFVGEAAMHTAKPKNNVFAFLRKPTVVYPAFGAIAMAAAVLIVLMGPWYDSPSVLTDEIPVAVRQSTRSLYAKAINANRNAAPRRAAARRTSNFRARAGHLAKRIELAKRLAYSRPRNNRTTR